MKRALDKTKQAIGGVIARDGTLVVTTGAFAIGALVSNLIGAAIVFAMVAWVVPVPQVPDDDQVRVINVLVLAGYLAFAVPAAALISVKRFRGIAGWLHAQRPATESERALVLRAPRMQMMIHATFWALAGVLFVSLNAVYSWRLGVVVGIAVLLGLLSTSALGYLWAERVTREIARLALEGEAPGSFKTPSLTTRVLLTWALSTGMPVLGVALIGGGIVVGVLPSIESQLAYSAMLLSATALITGMIAMVLVTRSVADPVNSLRRAVDRVRLGDLDASVPVYDASELGLLQSGFNDMVDGLRERERLHDIFGRHVGRDVAEHALREGVSLGGEVRHVGVLFVDVVGSTTLAATRPPEEVVDLLNRFFAIVVETVVRHGGEVNKFEGDAALAIFGAPNDLADAAGSALRTARELASALRNEISEIDIGIGVSAGAAVAGNVGSAERFEYTVIGDPVNEAARLTEIAKFEASRVAASSAAVDEAGGEAENWQLGDAITLRGRTRPTAIATPRR